MYKRQRMAIARALMKQPEIYVFDDIFSALDMKTDQTLRQNLKEIIGEATVILVDVYKSQGPRGRTRWHRRTGSFPPAPVRGWCGACLLYTSSWLCRRPLKDSPPRSSTHRISVIFLPPLVQMFDSLPVYHLLPTLARCV